MILIRLVYICCLLMTVSAQATMSSTPLVILTNEQTTIDLEDKLEVLKASKQGLSLQQISSPQHSSQFKPNNAVVTNYGYSDTDLWLRFDVKAKSSADWYLVIDYVVFGEAELFLLPNRSANAEITPAGDYFVQPIEQHRTPVWELQLSQNQVFSVYLRISNLNEPLILPVKLIKGNEFLIFNQYRYIFFTIILTGITVLGLYNIFLAFSLQDKSYLLLAIFIALIGIFTYRHSNLFPSVFGLLLGPENRYYTTLSFLTHAAGFYYWHLLHQNTEKWLASFTKGIAIISAILTLLSVFHYSSSDTFLLVFIPALLILPSLMIRAIILGYNSALSSFLAMLCLMLSVGIYAPLFTGIFPHYPMETFYIGQAGILIAILLFSLTHADRTRHLRIQAERTEANNKATHNFLTTMSHELRTPMHTVLGANELLRTTPLDQTQKKYLNSSELASRQMLELVDDVLDTARLHGPQPFLINTQPFNLHRLLDDLDELFSIQAKHKQLSFTISTRAIPPSKVMGDSKRLNQILVNLVGNAIRYTDHGTIKLLVSKHDNKPDAIHFAVQDTGPGIPAHQHALLFQPFFQADNSYSRSKDGAGLGLAISSRLVSQMGGELKLNSSPGEGSCFFFSLDLPIYVDQSISVSYNSTETSLGDAKASGPGAASKPLLGLKVLLIDDGELNLMIGEQLLTLQGAIVTTVNSGYKALDYLKQNMSFDLVLMDISMPGMDGYQTTRSIRQNIKLRKLPIVALTAHALGDEKERCLAAGMNDYLSKPFQTDQLLEMVRQYCLVK